MEPIEIKVEFSVLMGLREVNKTMREWTGQEIGVGVEIPVKMTLTLTPKEANKAGPRGGAIDDAAKLIPGSAACNELIRTLGRELKTIFNGRTSSLEIMSVTHAELGRVDI